ncbi:hypothetical protein [Cupriavidus basilensis]|uniref:hypothetical protein n=1 Tax=Cupriavidus basilensis TaxID=68895 RepID=UPI0039F658DE
MAKRFGLRIIKCSLDLPRFAENLQWRKYQEGDPAIVWLRKLLRETAARMPPIWQPTGYEEIRQFKPTEFLDKKNPLTR